ncbi:MAG: ribosome biogenesis GTP-binding protein YihA/YsxC [Flavobacteriales bacterium]|jgi:GTP-binding protein|nr:ribosome biogenesis GTP-binding protein YihA/YsxC [Flavobacteriales bacterium]MDP4716560.1 ribosome biogenesis GTP-binding protein YihA/YsxC [Flavobacteriales bacterium]MDP4731683.1 ribosome biogenesis GTP-binding protein YihA/YsxC [Flavobacteriales bacterium]MDP4819056.1 ribosome biogenesis GTP-binding protein YihA/YsxC [Flavobacteriales bacterium]MDP4951561.1 ribosome biogenesis GTP-binding protein YihA/YsxC [Flavobacteriales bacterium]
MSKELIHSATFVKSSVETDKCPPPIYPEFAFIGRSNVGKSSLINMLVNKKGLAKTSASPGKTQTINHFLINEEKHPWYLVDLPGYGYAKTSKTERNKWGSFIRNYLDQRENLICTFVLLDFRIPPQKIDLEFMQWLGEQGLPFCIAFTKCEKLTDLQKTIRFDAFTVELKKTWEELPQYFFTASVERMGRVELQEQIAAWRKEFAKDYD